MQREHCFIMTDDGAGLRSIFSARNSARVLFENLLRVIVSVANHLRTMQPSASQPEGSETAPDLVRTVAAQAANTVRYRRNLYDSSFIWLLSQRVPCDSRR